MRYYRLDRILEKNAVYNFIYGGRASGKSYAMGELLLDDYLDKGEQFIRVFRNSIFKRSGENYFTEIVQNNPEKYKDIKVTYDMNKYYINGEVFGYAIPLSMEQYKKSEQYPNCTKVVFEEFTALDNADYWDSEIEHFKSLLSTVFRHRTGKVFFIGNSLTLSNPYFDWLGIDPTGIQVGDCVSYTPVVVVNGAEELGASIAIEYVPIGYETAEEIPTMMRIPDNEIATSGCILESKRVHKAYTSYYIGDVFVAFEIDYKGVHYPPYSIKSAVWSFNNHKYNIAQLPDGVVFVQGEYSGIVKKDIYSEQLYNNYVQGRSCMPYGISLCEQFPIEAPDGDITILTKKKPKEIIFADQWTEYHYTVDRGEAKDNAEYIRKIGLGEPLYELDNNIKAVRERILDRSDIMPTEEEQYQPLFESVCNAIEQRHNEQEIAPQPVTASCKVITLNIGNRSYKIPENNPVLSVYFNEHKDCYAKKGRAYTCKKLDPVDFMHLSKLTAQRFSQYKQNPQK